MEQLKISELYSDLSKTLAKELLKSKTYPWESIYCRARQYFKRRRV